MNCKIDGKYEAKIKIKFDGLLTGVHERFTNMTPDEVGADFNTRLVELLLKDLLGEDIEKYASLEVKPTKAKINLEVIKDENN